VPPKKKRMMEEKKGWLELRLGKSSGDAWGFGGAVLGEGRARRREGREGERARGEETKAVGRRGV
jgi:hypothetical protein